MNTKKPAAGAKRTLDARRDTLDFRDRMYVPTLVEVPTEIALERYLEHAIPILDQGAEGACTGFGLATVAHYLLKRRRTHPDPTPVSPRMIYEMARRHDEWPGENYSGSSARGAMKGWHKHGICSEEAWPYALGRRDRGLTPARIDDALRRPLGAYFRVNHTDLVALHSAIAEVGVLYATAMVHAGWDAVGENGLIAYSDDIIGGHAFAIVAYDREGFWIQNSWGAGWGRGGFCKLTYDDWLAHGTDIWVARLGAPLALTHTRSVAAAHAPGAGESAGYAYADLRPHIVSIGNDGALRPGGDYGTSELEVQQLFRSHLPAAMAQWTGRRHVLLYAHGGLVPEATAVQRLADYRPALLAAQVYPVAFVWKTDYWTTIANQLRDAIARRRPEGVLDAAKDFMLDRLDDALEPLARVLTGKAAWDEMKENALAATQSSRGGARLALAELRRFLERHDDVAVHMVAHSAGAIFGAPLVAHLAEKGVRIDSCTLWAPACTLDLFDQYYRPLLPDNGIRRFAVYALTDRAEQDDHCAGIYHKSLLYLVSHAFEHTPRIPGDPARRGVPLLGMQKWIREDPALVRLFRRRGADLVLAPNDYGERSADGDEQAPAESLAASTARRHGDFDDDGATVRSTLARMLGAAAGRAAKGDLVFHRSASRLRERRAALDRGGRP